MNPQRWEQVREILDQAIALEVAQRSAYLDRVCGGEADLHLEVESLLLWRSSPRRSNRA